MQTVGNQTGGPFEKLEVLIAEGIQFIAIRIEHTENVPVVVALLPNHLYELLHSLLRAPAGQSEPANLLKLLARGFLHSRENNVAHKKTNASRISTFCSPVRLLDDQVGKTGVRADGRSIK